MDVILEAISIFIDEESFLIVFVCQKKAGAVEPIKSVSQKVHLLNAVARIQDENFLVMHQLVLDCNIAFDIDIGHDYAFF